VCRPMQKYKTHFVFIGGGLFLFFTAPTPFTTLYIGRYIPALVSIYLTLPQI
jgi:hypothetical protein